MSYGLSNQNYFKSFDATKRFGKMILTNYIGGVVLFEENTIHNQ